MDFAAGTSGIPQRGRIFQRGQPLVPLALALERTSLPLGRKPHRAGPSGRREEGGHSPTARSTNRSTEKSHEKCGDRDGTEGLSCGDSQRCCQAEARIKARQGERETSWQESPPKDAPPLTRCRVAMERPRAPLSRLAVSINASAYYLAFSFDRCHCLVITGQGSACRRRWLRDAPALPPASCKQGSVQCPIARTSITMPTTSRSSRGAPTPAR